MVGVIVGVIVGVFVGVLVGLGVTLNGVHYLQRTPIVLFNGVNIPSNDQINFI
jgi:hypothetical protein